MTTAPMASRAADPPPPAVPVAELCEVERVYRVGDQEVRALAGLSLRVERGQYWSIMGASGSGKSTLLNVVGCLDQPTAGRYRQYH